MPEIRQELVTCISACIIIIIAYKDRVHLCYNVLNLLIMLKKLKPLDVALQNVYSACSVCFAKASMLSLWHIPKSFLYVTNFNDSVFR